MYKRIRRLALNKYLLKLFILGFVILASNAPAYANLMITPFRVTFEDRTRSQVVTVINRSSDTRTLRIEWFETYAAESGRYIFEDDMTPEQKASIKSVQNIIRYSPRQIVLGPGQRQAIRIAVRKPADLERGEYRSHILFKQFANTGSARGNSSEEMGLQLFMNLSVSIPIIVRHGDLNYETEFIGGRFEKSTEPDKEDNFFFDLKQKGEASTYGSIKIYDARDTERSNQLAVLNNVYVFPEQDIRTVRIPTDTTIPSSVQNFVAVYEGRDEYDGEIFDEFTFTR